MSTTKSKIAMTGLMMAGLTYAPIAHAYDDGRGGGSLVIELTGYPGLTQDNKANSPLGGATDGSATAIQSGFSYDLRNLVGYKVWGNLMIGANFNYARSPMYAPATASWSSIDHVQTWTQWGGSLGFVGQNFRLIGTYIFSATQTMTSKDFNADGSVANDQVYENKGGSGYQVTLGYSFPVTSNFKVGPALVYRYITYKTQSLTNNVNPAMNYTDQAFTTDAVESNLVPMVSLIFQF